MGLVHKTGWRLAQYLATSLRPYHVQRLAILFAEHGRPQSERLSYTCPLCGYAGRFDPIFASEAMRFGGECPDCKSRERHRLIKLWMDRDPRGQDFGHLLHFAPEAVLQTVLRDRCRDYQTADIEPGRADLVLNMEEIDLPDAGLDSVMANHVLEHVDDAKALREIFRILKPGGFALLTTPVIPSWTQSYEDPSIVSPAERFRHFGQEDHVRRFGSDLSDRIRAAGFALETVVADGRDTPRFGLIPGDTVYLATRPTA